MESSFATPSKATRPWRTCILPRIILEKALERHSRVSHVLILPSDLFPLSSCSGEKWNARGSFTCILQYRRRIWKKYSTRDAKQYDINFIWLETDWHNAWCWTCNPAKSGRKPIQLNFSKNNILRPIFSTALYFLNIFYFLITPFWSPRAVTFPNARGSKAFSRNWQELEDGMFYPNQRKNTFEYQNQGARWPSEVAS